MTGYAAMVDREARPDLAVVLITRNQSWNVSRLVRSVQERTAELATALVLVDSASSDDTVQIARDLGLRVIELDGSQRLTAAAGRLAGQQASASEYLLFLDGDMELVDGWLEPALAALEQDERIAGIAGQVIDLPLPDASGTPAPIGRVNSHQAAARSDMVEAPFVGGAALYRRSALESVGSFDAGLYSEEEPELALRLRAAGYVLMMSGAPMVLHYTAPTDRLATTVARWRRNLFLGAGQVVRKHLGRPTLWIWLRERGFWIPPVAALLFLLAALSTWSLTGRPTWTIVWIATMAAVVAGLSWRRRSLVGAAHTLLKRLVYLDGFIRGFFLYPVGTAASPGSDSHLSRPTSNEPPPREANPKEASDGSL